MKVQWRAARGDVWLEPSSLPRCPGHLCRTNSLSVGQPAVNPTFGRTSFWPLRCKFRTRMFRFAASFIAVLVIITHPLSATTLAYASLDDLILKSSQIVRGTVQSLEGKANGSRVSTRVRIAVVERWKGPEGITVDVVVPGGQAGRITQTVSGAPDLKVGTEYVFFLWTGRTGVNRLLGFSQGVLLLAKDPRGLANVSRPPVSAAVVNATTGVAVQDSGVSMTLAELRERIRRVLAGGSSQ